MKFLIILAVAVACAAADAEVPIIKSNIDVGPEGFQYAYETGNGIFAQEQGALKDAKGEYPSIQVSGSFKYTSPDGVPVEIVYNADENGFQPQGAVIPTPPPIPELIARSLQYIAAHPPPAQKISPAATAAILG